jgi:glycosyltransferase involved in cell wall biosynthesis
MAEGLQARGHQVTVITAFPNHPFGQVYDGYQMRPWQWEEIDGVDVLRLPLFPDHSLSPVRRALGYGSFALSASTLGLVNSYKIKADVMYVYLPPLTVSAPAALFSRLFQAPIVYWITDLWPESLIAAGADIGPRMHRIIRRAEDWAYGKAHTICVNSPGFKENLIGKGIPPDKIKTVVDWADEDMFFPVEPDKDLAQQFGLQGKFNVVYGGNLGTVQRLDTVIEAAKRLDHIDGIQFVLIGDGTEEDDLKRQAAEQQVKNVRFIPRQPMEEIHRFFALADVLLVHLKRDPVFRMQIPSKTMAYMACGRPILCAVPGSAATVVHEAGAGIICPSEDPVAMADSVHQLHEMPKAERESMGERGRQAYLANYTRQVQVDRVERILKQASGSNDTGEVLDDS